MNTIGSGQSGVMGMGPPVRRANKISAMQIRYACLLDSNIATVLKTKINVFSSTIRKMGISILIE